MTAYSFGDVVLIGFPHTDLQYLGDVHKNINKVVINNKETYKFMDVPLYPAGVGYSVERGKIIARENDYHLIE